MWIFRVFESLRASLIFSFSIFLSLIATVVGTNLWFDMWVERLDAVVTMLAETDSNLQQMNALENMFFNHETIDAKFYVSGKSEYLTQRKLLIKASLGNLETLHLREQATVLHGRETVNEAIILLNQYEEKFDSLITLVKLRGFKDWGAEGEMRRAVHLLEMTWNPNDMELLLMARRHEKDFIIRKDIQYQQLLNNQIGLLNNYIEAKVQERQAKERLKELLHTYQNEFNNLVALEKNIGFDIKDEAGIRYHLLTLSKKLEEKLDLMNVQTISEATKVRNRIRNLSFAIMTGCLLVGVIISIYIAKVLGKPINDLSTSIHQVIKSNFGPNTQVLQLQGKNEIVRLSKDVSLMLKKVHESLDEVSQKSETLEKKQRQLIDSLRYAEQIQKAILPDDEDMNDFFQNHFVVYKPKNVVSGDFYWVTRRKGKVYIAVADCTGHGVPGAFMSMIGTTLLNKIVLQSKILDPNVILEVLHLEVIDALKQDRDNTKKNNDGMDIAICCVELMPDESLLVLFAGAKQDLYYSTNNELQLIKGTKRTIGGAPKPGKEQKTFVQHQIVLQKGDKLYLCSDGMADQHNEQGEKMGKAKLAEIITNCHNLPWEQQQDFLQYEVNAHQGTQEQRDDITFIGLQL